MIRKKKLVIKDWFKLVLWYVRLRRAARGQTPFILLDIEAQIQSKALTNALIKARKASLVGYVPYNGEEEAKDMQDESDDSDPDEIDMMLQY